MLIRLLYLLFIISAACAAWGILLSARLKTRFRSEVFSTLLFSQVFVFTFGFYAIWGHVILNTLLSDKVTEELMTRIFEISSLLGLPFLVFAWLMMIRFALEITGRRFSKWLTLWFLVLNFSIIFGVGIYSTDVKQISPASLIRYYFIGFNFIYTLTWSLIVFLPGHGKMAMQKYESRILSYSTIIIAVAQCLTLYLYRSDPWTGMLFIFIFFAGNAFTPVYLNYGVPLSFFMAEPKKDLSVEEFCNKYEISPRESEIIREICNGLSNQEISEKLFISLQTVKDHTHRIYIKTAVRSRVQLMNLVREIRQ